LHQRIKIRRRKGPDWRSREAGPSTPPEVKVTARATTTLFGSPAASQSTSAQGGGSPRGKNHALCQAGGEPVDFAPKAKVTAQAKPRFRKAGGEPVDFAPKAEVTARQKPRSLPGRTRAGRLPRKAEVTARAKTTLFARRQTKAERQTPPKAPQAPFGQIN
jgi:hypothetical protein